MPIVLITLFGVVITYTRLSQGPISLTRFAGPIEESISNSLGALSAKIEDVALVLTDDHSFEFRLINLELADSAGSRVAAAPIASVSLNPLPLLIGRVVPSRVYLIDPEVLVTYRKSSGFSLRVASKLIEEPSLIGEGRAARLTSDTERRVGSAQPPAALHNATDVTTQRIDVARLISELNARAQRGIDANTQLKEIGVRNATVTLDYEDQRSDWLIAEAAVGLEYHARGSTISGAARVQSDQGPWVFSFHTVESERENVTRLTVSARDLVPSSIASAAPTLSLLKTLDMPVALDATMQVTDSGDMEAATLAIEMAPGKVFMPSVTGTPLLLDGCIFNVAYDGYANRLTLAPSTLRWADSFMTISGEAMPLQPDATTHDVWRYQFSSVEGLLAAKDFGVTGINVDNWSSQGQLTLSEGKLDIESFDLAAGGVQFAAQGALLAGEVRPSTRVDARITSSDLRLLTALWPRDLAQTARQWVGTNVMQGQVSSGTLRLVSGGYMKEEAPLGDADKQRLSMALEVGDVAVHLKQVAAVGYAERALVRIENDVMELTIPEAKVRGEKAAAVDLKTVRVSAVGLYGNNPLSEVAFKVKTPVKSVALLAQQADLELFRESTIPIQSIRGLVEGDFKLSFPLKDDADSTIKLVEGNAKIKDLRFTEKLGAYAVRGGAFDIEVSDAAIDATGNILINGVGANVKVQHIIGAALDEQPPVKFTTSLDSSDRDQLRLDINDIVTGSVPVEVTMALRQGAPPAVHVSADLTSADLLFAEVAWRKPQGRAMSVEYDIVNGANGRTELQNIQVVGQGIAIEGWAALDGNQIVREFYFPDFSIDTVTRLRLQGKQDDNRIWNVKAVGPTYDGRTFFRSLFTIGDLRKERPRARNPAKGVDLEVEIENVVGGANSSLRQVKLTASHRDDKLTALNGKGVLDNGKQVAFLLRRNNGSRTLYAESNDMGKVFKLIDFYPNMVGGRGRLELDLDGQGAAEQTGTLWVENFRILGDEVASEVFANAVGQNGKRKVTRQVFDFSRLRMPFSIGHDQFVIQETFLRGPILGASVRGKVDYHLRRVNLGGTYIPLQGINSALCGIPLLGQIITGPKCEGMLGITYAVQGSMARPQVIVNPLSLVAPGIFRGIFELSNPNMKVVPRNQDLPQGRQGDRARSSSSQRQDRGQQDGAGAAGKPTIDGWSSGTRANP